MTETVYAMVNGTRFDIPGGWATVIVAFLTVVIGPAIIVVLTARVSGKVSRMSEDTSATRDQVVNSHASNMREESDDRHEQIMDTLKAHGKAIAETRSDIGGMRSDIRSLVKADQLQTERAEGQAERIRDLEKTQPRPIRRKKTNGEEL